MNEEELIKYYNKFNEDKRLNTKHGMIEFKTSIKYILDYLQEDKLKVLDVGAGTGKYSLYLDNLGYDVTAVELVKHNLRVLESKNTNVKCYQGNATSLTKFSDNSFDMVLLFGPMYHLIGMDEKIQALKEAKRVVKENGIIMISYCMNEYAVITHGFIDNNIREAINNKEIDKDFHIISKDKELYSFVRLEDINYLKDSVGLKREKIIAQDGPTEYIKKVINKMNDEELELFFKYHLATCERSELLGASRHILDILRK
jgi:ubiquinone/menaquinone biosynthesis C-methylase UbiE